jgi:hypothetical protein
MLEKINFDTTYAYRNFITDNQRLELEEWIVSLKDKMKWAQPVNDEEDQYGEDLQRHFLVLQYYDYKPQLFFDLRNKIIELEGITNPIPARGNGDWVGIVGKNSRVEPHKDANYENHYTRRYNLLVSFPNTGGRPIYDGELLAVEEKMIWRCDAGIIEHSSEPNYDDKLRINLSFGFSIPF